MKKNICSLVPWIILSVTLAGCDEKPYKAPAPKTEEKPAAILFQEQRQALEKAKGVEQTIEKRAEEDRKALDDATK